MELVSAYFNGCLVHLYHYLVEEKFAYQALASNGFHSNEAIFLVSEIKLHPELTEFPSSFMKLLYFYNEKYD